MQTQYRLLYRYINPTTNTAITNEADYEPTNEFYTTDHQTNMTADRLTDTVNGLGNYGLKYVLEGETAEDYATKVRNEGDAVREELITKSMANEDKSNNLYVYNGTKKIFHPAYIPEALGYVVRDWTKVPKGQIPDGPTDFSKHFVMLGGHKLGIDGAYLVCKPQYLDNYKTKKNGDTKCFLNISSKDKANAGYKKNASYYNVQHTYIKDYMSIVKDEVFFKVYDPNDETMEVKYNEQVINPDGINIVTNSTTGDEWVITKTVTTFNNGASATNYPYIFFNNDDYGMVPNIPQSSFSPPSNGNSRTTYTGWRLDDLIRIGFTVDKIGINVPVYDSNIIRDIIPAHYEIDGNNPYYIKDTYKKIQLSPWMVHSIHKSLESGLEAAKTLVAMLGINNVKLIKYVPMDQFIKVK